MPKISNEKLTNQNLDIAILILTFDGFNELWTPFYNSFKNAWSNCPYNIYILNNFQSSTIPELTDLNIGEDISWSDSLIKGLKKIEEKYVFILYEDVFFDFINTLKMEGYFKYAINNNLDALLLREHVNRQGRKYVTRDIFQINQNALYRNSLFMNLIKREVLLKMLSSGKNAWQFEIESNNDSKHYIYYSINEKLANYTHCIVKGKWYRNAYMVYSKKYNFVILNKKLRLFEEIKLKLKEKLFKIYYNILPLKILNIIEQYRYRNAYK